MKKAFRLSFMFPFILFLGYVNYVFSQEKKIEPTIYTIGTYTIDGIPVRLNSTTVEEENEYTRIYKLNITNLTNIKIWQIQLVGFVFDQNGKRVSSGVNNQARQSDCRPCLFPCCSKPAD